MSCSDVFDFMWVRFIPKFYFVAFINTKSALALRNKIWRRDNKKSRLFTCKNANHEIGRMMFGDDI